LAAASSSQRENIMNRLAVTAALAAVFFAPSNAIADSAETAEIKRMLSQMKADYERRIAARDRGERPGRPAPGSRGRHLGQRLQTPDLRHPGRQLLQ
jgi:hypothetical protein